MMHELKPYPKMKDSGVEWLGEVPQHWEVRRLKATARLIMGQSPPSEDCSSERIGLPFLQGCAEFGTRYPAPVQYCRAPSKVSPREAILMSVRAPVGRLNIADQAYGIGRGLCAIIPHQRSFSPNFARYELEVIGHGFAIASTGSTYDAVSTDDVGVQPTILPPLQEQTAIVRYLDYIDRRVQRLVQAKRKLITLLEEQKQAIIHRAVTRGLDPNVRLKPSGVEWLGDVPEHWETLRVGHFSKVGNGSTPSRGNAAYWIDGVHPWLSSSSVNQGIIARANQFVTD
ncbi:restriction endonuclease subunit S, partial [bacterium]|nr:restriction endonuclease subunit S [bacterium]